MDVARRGFLSGRYLTRAGREDLDRHIQALGPPPPWHRLRLTLETCRECDAPCRAACTEDVIRIHGSEHALAGIPYLSFVEAGCTYCGDCARACPIEGLDPVGSTSPDIGSSSLDEAKCLAWNRVICMSCGHACTEHAIRFDRRGRPSIEASRCNGCGRCVGICPAHAIEVVWSVDGNTEASGQPQGSTRGPGIAG